MNSFMRIWPSTKLEEAEAKLAPTEEGLAATKGKLATSEKENKASDRKLVAKELELAFAKGKIISSLLFSVVWRFHQRLR